MIAYILWREYGGYQYLINIYSTKKSANKMRTQMLNEAKERGRILNEPSAFKQFTYPITEHEII